MNVWIFSRSLEYSCHIYSIILLSSLFPSQPPLWSNSKGTPLPHSPWTALFLTFVLPTSLPKFADNSQGQALSVVIKGRAESDWIHNSPVPRGMPAAVCADLLQQKLCYLALPQQERTGNQHFWNALIHIFNLVAEIDGIEIQLQWHNTLKEAWSKCKAKSYLWWLELSSINPASRIKPIYQILWRLR